MQTAFAGHPRNKDSQSFLVPRIPRETVTQASTDHMTRYLVSKFESPEYAPAFNKIAWCGYTMAEIIKFVEASYGYDSKGRPIGNHRAYFLKAVHADDLYKAYVQKRPVQTP